MASTSKTNLEALTRAGSPCRMVTLKMRKELRVFRTIWTSTGRLPRTMKREAMARTTRVNRST